MEFTLICRFLQEGRERFLCSNGTLLWEGYAPDSCDGCGLPVDNVFIDTFVNVERGTLHLKCALDSVRALLDCLAHYSVDNLFHPLLKEDSSIEEFTKRFGLDLTHCLNTEAHALAPLPPLGAGSRELQS